MKKYVALTILLLLVSAGSALAVTQVAAAATHAIAADFASAGGQVAVTVGGSKISKLSTGVELAWNVNPAGYAIVSAHSSGTKSLGTSHDSTAIYVNETKPLAAPTSYTVSGVNGAGWSSL